MTLPVQPNGMDPEQTNRPPPSLGPVDRVVVAPPSQIPPASQEDPNDIATTVASVTDTTKRKHRATKPAPTHVFLAQQVRLLMRTPDGKSLVQFADGSTGLHTDPLVPLDVVKQYL
jgi:hypothetical protein